MILIGEGIQRLQSIYSQGAPSSSVRLSKRQIYSNLLSGRSELIAQISNKNQYINSWIYQTLFNVELENVSTSNIPEVKSTNILRSKKKIPVIVSDMDTELFMSVTSIDGSINYSSTTYAGDKYKSGTKYPPYKGSYYVKDGYLYFTDAKFTKSLTFTAIFEDPLEVFIFNYDDCKECKCMAAEEVEFPIDRKLLKTMMELAYAELTLFVQMMEDTTNDAEDDSRPPKMIHQ